MTRAEIITELDRVACEWRVPLKDLRGERKAGGAAKSRLVVAARAVFMRRMFAEGVAVGHAAWALNISRRCASVWYVALRKAEQQWWAA